MTKSMIAETVDKAIVLDRRIKELKTNFDELKGALISEASGRPDEHAPTEGGGASVTFPGSDGCVAVVTFPADRPKSEIDPAAKSGKKLIERLGRHAARLLESVQFYRPAKDFRDAVHDLWPMRDAERIIAAFETDSTPRVSFETAERGDRQTASAVR